MKLRESMTPAETGKEDRNKMGLEEVEVFIERPQGWTCRLQNQRNPGCLPASIVGACADAQGQREQNHPSR